MVGHPKKYVIFMGFIFCPNHQLMMVATRSYDSLSSAIQWNSPKFSFTFFFRLLLLEANYLANPHIPIPSIESQHILSVVFPRVCHPWSCYTNFRRTALSVFGFHGFHRCLFRSPVDRTLLSNQSSIPIGPFPSKRRPWRFNNGLVFTVDAFLLEKKALRIARCGRQR